MTEKLSDWELEQLMKLAIERLPSNREGALTTEEWRTVTKAVAEAVVGPPGAPTSVPFVRALRACERDIQTALDVDGTVWWPELLEQIKELRTNKCQQEWTRPEGGTFLSCRDANVDVGEYCKFCWEHYWFRDGYGKKVSDE